MVHPRSLKLEYLYEMKSGALGNSLKQVVYARRGGGAGGEK